MCFVRLAEMVVEPTADRLIPRPKRGVHLVIGKSPEQWQSYRGKPFSFASHSKSLLADNLVDSVQVQLDYEIDSQLSIGSRAPNWAWNQYEFDWQKGRLESAGWLTLRNLIALKKLGSPVAIRYAVDSVPFAR